MTKSCATLHSFIGNKVISAASDKPAYGAALGTFMASGVKVKRCMFRDNVVRSLGRRDGGGGAMVTYLTNVEIFNSTFWNNDASNGYGKHILVMPQSNVTLSFANVSGSGTSNTMSYDIYAVGNGHVRSCTLVPSSQQVSVFGGTCSSGGTSSTTTTATTAFCTGTTTLTPQLVTTTSSFNSLLEDWSKKACTGVIYLNPTNGYVKFSRRYTFEGLGTNITIIKSSSYTGGSHVQLLASNGDGHLSFRNGAILTARNLEFVNSTGGSVLLMYGSVGHITDCVFRGNHNVNQTRASAFSHNQYPALSAISATVACYNWTFRDNLYAARKFGSGYGGSALGVASGSHGIFKDTTFTNNTVLINGGDFSGGGAVTVDNAASVSFRGCIWTKNRIIAETTASNGVRGGGAVVFQSPGASFSACSFTSNSVIARKNGTEAGFGGLFIGGGWTGFSMEKCR